MLHLTKNIKPEFKDARGVIAKILDDGNAKIRSILYITGKKGTMRANHYHKKDTHWVYMLSGKMTYFEKSIKEDRFEILSRLNLAMIYKRNNDLASAIMTLREILSFAPANEEAMVGLVQVYQQLGDTDNVLKLAQILLKQSHHPLVLRNAAILSQWYGQKRTPVKIDKR